MKYARAVSIHTLPVGFQWSSEDANGCVSLAGPLRKRRRKGGLVSHYATLAVALTQVASERKRGKVYFLFRDQKSTAIDNQDPDHFDAYNEQMRAPGLIYVAEDWTEEARDEWKTLSPVEQLERCCVVQQAIEGQTLVLPFSATVYDLSCRPVQILDGWRFPASLSSPVVVCISGEHVVAGVVSELLPFCYRDTSVDTVSGRLVLCDYVAAEAGNWAPLEHFFRSGFSGVLNFFETTLYTQPELAEEYLTVLEQAQRGYRAALHFRQLLTQQQSQQKADVKSERQALEQQANVKHNEIRAQARKLWQQK